jgi:gas vesicle protein
MADNSDGFMRGFILGGIIGAALGLFLAPKSGHELREDLSGEAEKLLAKAKDDIENAKKAAMKSFEEGKDKILEKLVHEKVKKEPESEAKAERPRRTRTRPRRAKPQSE